MDTVATLTRRLDRLEREARCWRAGGFLSLLALSSLAVMGQATGDPPAEAVRAKAFILVDAAGKPRAELRADDTTTSLTLADPAGRLRAALVVADGPGLRLSDQAGKPRAVLNLAANGRPGLTFADQAGQPRAGLALGAQDRPGLQFVDQAGHPRATLGLGTAGRPGLVLGDQAGHPRATLDLKTDGQPGFQLTDQAGQVFWSTPSRRDG